MIKNIGIFSSTRADYGYLKPVAKTSLKYKLNITFFVAGMHLHNNCGLSAKVIKDDGFAIKKITSLLKKDEQINQANIDGSILQKLPDLLKTNKIDILIILGDRPESLAAALSACHCNIAVAHIHGGDLSYGGGIDDSIRHAITKLAHLHFPSCNDSAKRIMRLQEESWRIKTTGELSVEDIAPPSSIKSLRSKYGFYDDFCVVLHHAEAQRIKQAPKQLSILIRALRCKKIHPIIILPNDDPGGKAIIEQINNQSKKSPVTVMANLQSSDFFDLLRNSLFLIGNSSAGIIETPYLGVASINLGIRQKGRKSYVSTLNGEYNLKDIKGLIDIATSGGHKKKIFSVKKRLQKPSMLPSVKIIEKIKSTKLDIRFFQKQMR